MSNTENTGSEVTNESGQQNAAATEEKFFTPDKIILLVALITYGIGQSILYVVFPPIVEDIGLTKTQFGLVIAISNVALAFGAMFWGRKSDTFGRKRTMVVGLFGYALGTFLLASTLEWGLEAARAPLLLLGIIMAARLTYASIASAINPGATAYLADTTSKTNRAKGMALLGMSAGIGTMLGPVIGGSFAFVGPVFPMYIAIALALASMTLIAVKIKEPSRHVNQEEKPKGKLSAFDPRVFPYLLCLVTFWMVFSMNQILASFYLEQEIGIEGSAKVAQATATVLFSMAITATITQIGLIGKFNLGPIQMMRIGFPVFALGMLVLLIANSLPMMWLGFGCFGVAMALCNAGCSGAASISVGPEEQGSVGGFLSAMPIFGMVAGPLLGPFLFDTFSPTMPVMVALAILILLSLFSLTLKVKSHDE